MALGAMKSQTSQSKIQILKYKIRSRILGLQFMQFSFILVSLALQ